MRSDNMPRPFAPEHSEDVTRIPVGPYGALYVHESDYDALAERLRECEAERDRYKESSDYWFNHATDNMQRAEAVEAQARRYRFLRDNAGIGFQMVMQERREPEEWDAEIDDAIAALERAAVEGEG